MTETLNKLREPAAWVVLGVVGLDLLLSVLGYLTFSGFGSGLGEYSGAILQVLWVVLIGLTALWCCWDRPSPNARTITLLGAILVGVGVMLHLLLLLTGFGSAVSLVNQFQSLLAAGFKAAIGAGLLVLFLRLSALQAPALQPMVPPQGLQPGVQPTWQPDQAAARGWNRAGDAASGAQATQWGTPGAAPQGWALQPPPQQPPPGGPGHLPAAPVEPVPSASLWGPPQAAPTQQPPAGTQPPAPAGDWWADRTDPRGWAGGSASARQPGEPDDDTVVRPADDR